MKQKRIVAFFLASVMALSLVGCGGSDNVSAPADDSEATDDEAPVDDAGEDTQAEVPADTLTVAIWDNNQEPGLSQILEDFTADTGIKAQIQVTPWDQYWTMLEAGATGGSLPDVFWMHSNVFTQYAEYDMLMDLTDKINDSADIDLSKYPADIVGLYNYDGKQFAVPKDYDTIALWYNKTMFDEAGISYPDDTWTWDTFADAAKKLTKDDGSQYGFAMATSNNQDGWYNIVYSMGGEIINDAKDQSGLDNPNTIKAIKFISDLAKDCAPAYDVMSENNPETLLSSGTVAMAMSGSWMLPAVCDMDYVKENCDLAVLPKDAGTGKRVSIYNGLGWAAAANTDMPDEAWKLIEYLGSEKAQQKQSDLGIVISAYEGTEKNWINSRPEYNLQAYLDMAGENMVFRPYSKKTTVWENTLTENLVDVWTGDVNAETRCKEIAEEMNAALADE